MILNIALTHQDCIYHAKLKFGDEITIGSHKKDQVIVDQFLTRQIRIQWKGNGITVSAKKAYEFEKSNIPTDAMLVLDKESNTILCITSEQEDNKQTLKLPYRNCTLKFGREDDNDIVIKYPFISGHHFLLKCESGNVRVEDLDSLNGIYLNGHKVKIAKMKNGDTLTTYCFTMKLINGELHFEGIGDKLTIKDVSGHGFANLTQHVEGQISQLIYRRSPRMQEELPNEDVVLANAPSKGQKYEKGRGIFSSLIGSSAMIGASMLTGVASPALLAARAASLVSPITSVATSSGANKKRKKTAEQYEILRREKYGAYIDDQKARIESVAQIQRNILSQENPSPREWIDVVYNLKRNLWERIPTDRDFLDVRIGMGYEDLCVSVKSRNDTNGFQMESDEVRELSEQIIEETRIVDNVPARISLKKNSSIGVIGNRRKVVQLVKNMMISLTASHCYEEVRIVGIFDKDEQHIWEPAKWLPHIWDENQQFRNLSFDKQNAHIICDRISEILKQRKRNLRENTGNQSLGQTPHYILFFGSKEMVEQEDIMRELFGNSEELGITSVFLFNEVYMLPNDCKMIVDVNDGPSAYERNVINKKFIFTMDVVITDEEFDSYTRRMSAIELEGFATKAGIPDSVSFLQGYGVKKVEELNVLSRWNSSDSCKKLAAPIGIMAGNKIFSLDIHEKAHGPHGLVAGTTGSGKSELLQTWVLSMCVTYHPHDVSFVLIDYKGGGMANLLEPLPHVVGKITNIGSNITRSLISLQSEIKRRQAIFEQYNVNHIDKYQQLYKSGMTDTPLPHLIIVTDEFAELKKEEPDFMSGLISASRVGRSLGIHLVLATQKPGGVVDDQIQSNSRFRLCMKVQDVNDSREMLKRPDAAKIIQAGRTYIRVGEDEIFELFQAFWSGAPYEVEEDDKDVENQVRIVELNGQRIQTVESRRKAKSSCDELTAIVQYICRICEDEQIVKLSGPWMPELPEIIALSEVVKDGFDGQEWHRQREWLRIPIGKYDSPQTQTQGTQYIDFSEEGHYGIYGAPGAGKTTLLKTIVLSLGLMYSPKDVNIYILDCGGWSLNVFASMPHVGGVILDGEEEKFAKFEKLIMEEVESRKLAFFRHAVSSLAAYRESVSSDLPAIVIAIDNMVSVFELYPDYENVLAQIAREGATYGIYLVYTANSGLGIRYRVMQNIKGAIALELTDKADYANLVGRLNGMILPGIQGRAFIKGNPPLEFQSALYSNPNSEHKMTMELQNTLNRMKMVWKGQRPKQIPVMPDYITEEYLISNYKERTKLPVGINCEDVTTRYVDLTENYNFLITGTIQSGKSRMLKKMGELICMGCPENQIFVFDGNKKSLIDMREKVHKYISISNDADVTEAINEIIENLNHRKKEQNLARQNSEKGFDEQKFIQSYKMICIIIDDLKEFVDGVTNENKDSMERICRLAQHLGVVVLCSGRITDISRYNEIESLTRVIVSSQNGLAVGGTPAQHSYFQNNLSYAEKDKEAGEGFGYFYENGKCFKVKIIE